MKKMIQVSRINKRRRHRRHRHRRHRHRRGVQQRQRQRWNVFTEAAGRENIAIRVLLLCV
jgi:hypothetical protein